MNDPESHEEILEPYEEVIFEPEPGKETNKTFCLIPIEIAKDKSLKAAEKILLSEIVVQDHYNGEFFGSNQYLASLVNLSRSRVSGILSELGRRGYIRIIQYRCPDTYLVWKRVIKPNMYTDAEVFSNKQLTAINKKYKIGKL